jgi:Lon protease-like protein
LDSIPKTWPPSPEEGGPIKRIVPLLPISRLWLFPYVVLPLNVVEERYRRMIEDSLDGPGRLVLGTVPEAHEHEMEGSPPVYPIAGMGEIGRHRRLDDGTFEVLLFGLQRVHLRELESSQPYRMVEADPAIEIEIPRERENELRARLIDAILERTTQLTSIPPQIPTSHLADLLTLRMPLPHPVMNQLYCEFDVEKRGVLALEQHAVRERIDDDDDEGKGEEGAGPR